MDPMTIIFIACAVLSYLLRPKPESPPIPEAGTVNATTVDANSDVPVLFGTRKMQSPNVVWYGDIGVTPIVNCQGGKK